MRNEVSFSSQVALDGTSKHRADNQSAMPDRLPALVKAFSCRTSLNHKLAPAGQRSLPSSCRVKASAVKRPAARPDSPAHCHGPYSSGGSCQVKNRGAVSVGGPTPSHEAHLLASSFPG